MLINYTDKKEQSHDHFLYISKTDRIIRTTYRGSPTNTSQAKFESFNTTN